MRAVNISELGTGLSASIRSLREGEEILVSDQDVPVARILPFRPGEGLTREAKLVASGDLKMPEKEMNWEAFFALPAANVPWDIAVQASLEGRGDQ